METKNYTEVLIDGKIYTMGGYEEEGYLQRVASYLNARIGELKQQNGFMRLPADLRTIQIYLNLADDYFKARKVAEDASRKLNEQERELYQIKHDLVTAQMKLEQLQRAAEQSSAVAAEQTEYLQDRQEQQTAARTENRQQKQSRNHSRRQGGQYNNNMQKKQYMPSADGKEPEKNNEGGR
ncbi:cell division protein ZapA [Cuneatibacter caecimuris]|uniref:Cell division protein ZapA n=1 Tax=Cuneatibacter caecimuris TaxID=1796618 RepID=A0A4Q7PMF4_9FIRM|nr:cell division protein ZapA [Cuneatibacter caecimuris]RZT02024.1 cell division protein ZapA [Cuneatibacter caecimuris]